MDKAKLLEKYIKREFGGEPLTEEQKAAVAETMEFASFCLREVVDQFWDDIWNNIADAWRQLFQIMSSADEEAAPDIVAVVRCKDCKHLFFKDLSAFCPYSVGPCKPDGFCSYGERKEGK